MFLNRRIFAGLSIVVLLCAASKPSPAQQVVQRGTFGKPAQVMDETQAWTTPLLLVSDDEVQIYMPDISSSDWLSKNYPEYRDRGTYKLSMFTFYKSPKACRINMINWGLGDGDHLNECISIGYRVRRALINPHEKSVTLLMAAMVDDQGSIKPSSIQTEKTFRFWNQLDANTQQALEKANHLVEEQMKIYDHKMQNSR
jgi:hypothetical protein